MKIKISQSDFSKALLTGGKSILPKANLPILSNVLIRSAEDRVEILATNLETATRVTLGGKVDNGGEATVNGRIILDFVSQLPEGEVIIEKLGEELVVSQGTYSARFTTMPVDEFPAIPKIEKGITLEIDCPPFAGGVFRVVFSAAQDEGRPMLTGVLCEVNKNKLKMVATDGYRLSFGEIGTGPLRTGPNLKFNIPAKALGEVAKIIVERGLAEEGSEKNGKKLSLIVSEGLNQVSFKLPGQDKKEEVEFTSRLIEGEFPNWQKIIPSVFNTKAKIPKDEFVKLVRMASIFAREAGNIVKLKLEPAANGVGKRGKFSVSATSVQTGSSDVASEVEIEGKGGEIAFNYRYLLEVLATVSGNEVYFEMNESLNPGRITTEDPKDSSFHIIMPVRLQA